MTKRASSSSSIIHSSDRSSDRESEDRRRRRQIEILAANGRGPEFWVRTYETPGQLADVLERTPLSIPYPKALDLIARFGLQAVEAAALSTMADCRGGGIRKPAAWLHSTLLKGLTWTPQMVSDFIDHEWDKEIRAVERSDDVSLKRAVAAAGEGLDEVTPGNVVDLEGARAEREPIGQLKEQTLQRLNTNPWDERREAKA